jgi:hypothetical protein
MFIGGPCHGAIEHIEGYFILRFQGLEDRWQFSTENLATLWQKGNTKPIRPEPEPIIMLTLKYSRNMVHVCVCVPFNDFCVVFFGDSQWEKDHDSTFALSSVVLQRSHPMAVLVELQSPEITSHIKVHWSATANCWMPWDMPSARWRTWRAHYCKAWGEWKPTKPLDYGCLKFSISSCEPKWLLQILECFA